MCDKHAVAHTHTREQQCRLTKPAQCDVRPQYTNGCDRRECNGAAFVDKYYTMSRDYSTIVRYVCDISFLAHIKNAIRRDG